MTLPHDDDQFWPARVTQPIGAPPPTVLTAKAPDEQAHLLELLAGWVNWLTDRYHLDHRTVPVCWPDHGDLTEELAALQLAWQAAYGQLAHGDAPLLWHEHFALARERLRESVARSGCRATEHR